MKKTLKNLAQKLEGVGSYSLNGGFLTIKGGKPVSNSFSYCTNTYQCTNSPLCSSTNTGSCSNGIDCQQTTNSGSGCVNAICFA